MAVIKRPSAPLLSDDQKLDEVPQRSHEDIYQKAEEWGIETNPLDIETLVKRYGIKVVREEMDIDLSGYIEKRQNYWVIGINKYQTSRRQRFTLAHEFAHFLFDKAAIEAGRLTDQIMLRSEEVNPKEQRANEFAAKLLMPKHLFKEQVENGLRDIAELAERFDVSMAAIRYRAYKLGYIKRY